jgi:hypothetical protein
MQFPLHLPCASMGVSLRTSMGCLSSASRWLTTASCSVYAHPMVSLVVSALAGTCNVLQASTVIGICLLLLQLSWCWSNEDIT